MKNEDLKFEEAMNILTDKLAEIFRKKDRSLLDIEFFILKFLNSFEELSPYEIIGILEQCKQTFINLDWSEDEAD